MPISQEYPELVASIQFLWAEELKANPLAKPIEFLLKHLKRRHGALTLFKKFRNDCPAEAGCCALCTFMWEDFLLNWMYHAERSLVVRITTSTTTSFPATTAAATATDEDVHACTRTHACR